MLDFAIKHRGKLNDLWLDTIHKEKFKYFNYGSYSAFEIELSNDTWCNLQMVSVDSKGDVIGFLYASIDRDTRNVTGISAINFYDVNYTFSKDFRTFLTDLFDKYRFNKISFSCAVNNPAMKMYDKYIEKYGGRILGVRKGQVRLFDGLLYDDKMYEITHQEYLYGKLNNNK